MPLVGFNQSNKGLIKQKGAQIKLDGRLVQIIFHKHVAGKHNFKRGSSLLMCKTELFLYHLRRRRSTHTFPCLVHGKEVIIKIVVVFKTQNHNGSLNIEVCMV